MKREKEQNKLLTKLTFLIMIDAFISLDGRIYIGEYYMGDSSLKESPGYCYSCGLTVTQLVEILEYSTKALS